MNLAAPRMRVEKGLEAPLFGLAAPSLAIDEGDEE
jgi:hypothetical protein